MTTIFQALTGQTTRLGDRPAVVFTDASTGERTELGFATLHNWVSKTANLLVEAFDLGLGSEVRLDLPLHWMVPVIAHGAWAVGASVRVDPGGDVLVGHESGSTSDVDLVIGSAMGGRPTSPLSGDALTVTDILAQPDDFIEDPQDEGAWAIGSATQAILLADRIDPGLHTRVLHAGDRVTEETLLLLAASLPGGVGVVLARGHDAAGLTRLADQENVD